MKVIIEFDLDDEKVFKRIPEAERTDEMRDYIRSGLKGFYESNDDNEVTEALISSARGEIDAHRDHGDAKSQNNTLPVLNQEQRKSLREEGWYRCAEYAELLFRGFDLNWIDVTEEQRLTLYNELYAIADEVRDKAEGTEWRDVRLI